MKIIGLAALSASLPVLVILAVMGHFQAVVSRNAQTELQGLAQMTAARVAKDIYGLCEVSHDLIRRKIDLDLIAVREAITKKGKITNSGSRYAWTLARNQYTGQEKSLQLPQLMAGRTGLGNAGATGRQTALIGEQERLGVGAWTIFQRIDDQGDMLRLETNILLPDGRQATGTFIPAINPDGQANPIVESVLAGRKFQSLEYINHIWYLTLYDPLRSEAGDIVGMVCVGEKLEAVESLRKTIAAVEIGKGGEVSILGTRGRFQGRYIVSQGGMKDGQDIWNREDGEGHFYVQSIMQKALAASGGVVTYEFYTAPNAPRDNPDPYIAAVTYFEPYDWLIIASAREADFLAPVSRTGDSLRWLLLVIAGIGLSCLIIAVLAAATLGQQITKLVRFFTAVAKNIAAGDIRKARRDLAQEFKNQLPRDNKTQRPDDTAMLFGAFGVMAERLETKVNCLQAPVSSSNRQDMDSAHRISTGKTNEVDVLPPVTAMAMENQNAVMVREVVRGISQTQLHLDQSLQKTQTTRAELSGIEDNMRGLSEVTAGLSSRFTNISDQASQISKGVMIINAIADRANLLALNASITAEKAGKFGKGFTLVARDAGRLSSQTEAAARHISGVVQEIQTTTTEGLSESDQVNTTVQHTVMDLTSAGDRLDGVVDHLQAQDAELRSMNQVCYVPMGILGPNEDVVRRLSSVSLQTKESLHQFKVALEGLNEVADTIQGELSHQGFSVVAREVRQMVEQKVIATRDIDAAVNELQVFLDNGLARGQRMDKAVLLNVAKVEKISKQLYMVIDHLQTYEFKIKEETSEPDHGSVEVQRVSDAMGRLASASLQARESLKDFRQATDHLTTALRHVRQ
jgi:methyl-accepting chemotaxis protein